MKKATRKKKARPHDWAYDEVVKIWNDWVDRNDVCIVATAQQVSGLLRRFANRLRQEGPSELAAEMDSLVVDE